MRTRRRGGRQRKRCGASRHLRIGGVIRKLLLLALVAALAVAAWEWITFPNVAELAAQPPKSTAFMDQRRAEQRAAGKDDRLDYRWTSYANISPYLRRA